MGVVFGTWDLPWVLGELRVLGYHQLDDLCVKREKKTRDPLLGKRCSVPRGPAYIPFTQILRSMKFGTR